MGKNALVPGSRTGTSQLLDHSVGGALLPEGVAVLTAGVDVQGDRLELHVVGWAAMKKRGRSTIA